MAGTGSSSVGSTSADTADSSDTGGTTTAGAVPPEAGEVWTITAALDGGDGLVLGHDGVLYVSEPAFNDIRSVTLDGEVDVFATGFSEDYGMSLAPSGDIYVANWGAMNILRVSPRGVVSEFFAVDGRPGNVFVEPSGEVLIPLFYQGYVLRVLDSGRTSRITFGVPNEGLHGLMYDADGVLYTGYHQTGTVNRVFEDGTEELFAQLPGQLGNLLFFEGVIYVTGYDTSSVYRITPAGEVELFAGGPEAGYADGPALDARFTNPNGLIGDADNRALYVSESGGRVRGIELVP